MKKIIFSVFSCFFALLLAVGGALPPAAAACYTLPAGTQLHAKAVYMMNVETGTVVYELDPHRQVYPASVAKLMTALVAVELSPSLDEKITVYEGVVDDLLGTGASVAGLLPGEQLTMRQLLGCLLVPSACDAANAIAIALCGSVEAFVAQMNLRASTLGMNDSYFTNAHGLHDPAQVTSAYDLVQLGKEILNHPELTELCASVSYTLPPTNLKQEERVFETTNFMINPTSSWYYRRVQGLKTGYTDDAGRNLLSLAEKDGRRYLTAVLGCPVETLNGYQVHHEFDDTDALLHWAFTDLDYLCVVQTTRPVGEVKVTLCADTDYVTAVPSADFYAIVPSQSAESVLLEPHLTVTELRAPVEQGTPLGTATVLCAGEEVGTVQLVAQQSCKRSLLLWIRDWFVRFSKVLLVIAAVLVLLIAAFVVWNVRVNRRRRRLWNSKVRDRAGEADDRRS